MPAPCEHKNCVAELSCQRVWHNSGYYLLSCNGQGPHWHMYCNRCHREWVE